MKRHGRAPKAGRITGLTLTIGVAFLWFFVFPSNSFAVTKRVINEIGSSEVLESGGNFNTPGGVAVNQSGAGGVPAGTFYVVESKDRRVQRFDPDGAFVSTWGFGVHQGAEQFEICTQANECHEGYPSGTDGAAGSFESPLGIAVDPSNGNVFVSDSGFGGRVDVFSAQGAFEGAFGSEITGDFSEQLEFCTTQSGCGLPIFANGHGGDFFNGIGGLAVDAAGHVYVANPGYHRIDVFTPTLTGDTVTGIEFLRSFGWGVEAENPEFEVCTNAANCREGSTGTGSGQFANNSPSDVAVDSEGHIFALDAGNDRVQEFDSTPAPMTPSFGSAALEGVFGAGAPLFNIAIDPSLAPNHLLVSGGRVDSGGKVAVAELDGSGGNALGAGNAHGEDLAITAGNGLGVAKLSLGGNLYVSTATAGVLRGVFVLGEIPTVDEVTEISGTGATFKGRVVSRGIDVRYHFEYSTDGKAWTRVPAVDIDAGSQPGEIAVEAKATNLTGSQPYRVRLVQNRPSGGGVATSDELTFVTHPEKPAIERTVASPIGDTSATFDAYLDPQNEPTSYRFEYGPSDCSANPCTALPLSQASGGGPRLITQTVTGLQPSTTYHFRLVATNATGSTEGPDRAFQTFATGRQLPDDRAYELVTPPDTGAVVLAGFGFGTRPGCFDMFPVTADGDSVVSLSKGGALPGMSGRGIGDLYESVRGPEGWATVSNSVSGSQSTVLGGGLCVSSDHRYSTLGTGSAPGDQGSLVDNGKQSNYIRVPGGVVNSACSPEPQGLFELIGCGSLGVDPEANARWITEKASHIVFTSRGHLESAAPPAGTEAVYDRSLGGPTRVVSLLPGEVSPGAGERAEYQGASVDGSTVAFKVPANGALYARVDNSFTIGTPDVLVGETLTCTGGPTSGAIVLNYQWLRNGAAISGATDPSYTIGTADEGTAVQCQVTATNTVAGANGEFAGSTQVSNPAAVVDPAPATRPPSPPSFIFATPSGTLTVPGPPADRTLTCNPGAWSGSSSFAYQWYQNGVAISGANHQTYVVAANSLTQRAAFQCAVTGVNAGGSVTKVSFTTSTSPGPSPSAPNASASTPSRAKTFAGISDDGSHLFYLLAGDVFDLDTESGEFRRLTDAGNAQLVNISGDGSHVYFISKSVLTGTEQNSQDRAAEGGESNLYVWDRTSEATHFVTVVDPKDVLSGAESSLTNWTSHAVNPEPSVLRGRANDTSRTTPDGSVFLFESRANVTGYDSADHVEIYRYDSDNGALDCVSCPPDGAAASGNARLESNFSTLLNPTSAVVHIQNVTDDGQTVFFDTEDALVPGDVNETWDVYEWKAGQQAYLISSGHGQLPSHLYGMTPTGSDVFFTSAEKLVPQDLSTVISIYDARVGGGFPVAESQIPCQGDNCQGTPEVAPGLAVAGSASFEGPGNKVAKRKLHCRKNQRRVKRKGKLRCVKRNRHKVTNRHHRASHNGRAGR